MDGVVGKELLELGVQLGGQRLVVRHDQHRPLHVLDHVGHGEGLARAGHAHQHLVFFAAAQPLGQGLDGLGLIAGGFKRGDELEHGSLRASAADGNLVILSAGALQFHREVMG